MRKRPSATNGVLVLLCAMYFVTYLDRLNIATAGPEIIKDLGPIWSVPMDIAPKYAGTGSGLMNTGSAVAAIVSPIVFGLVVDLTGDWTLPFVGSIGLCLLGAALAFTMHPERPFEEAAEPEPRAARGAVPAAE